MGNLCGRESDPFSQPGRRLGSAPATPASVSVPASGSRPSQPPRKPTVVGGPPRTLGGSSGGGGGGGGGDPDDARRKAAAAAQARFEKSQQGGKLQSELNKKRAMTNAQLVQETSQEEARRRELDRNTEALAHN